MPKPRRAARAARFLLGAGRLRRAFGAAATLACLAGPVAAEGLAGPYLAGRYASGANDSDAAARYLLDALGRDPGNAGLADLALINLIAAGRVGEALPVAEDLAARDPANRLANLTLLARDLRDSAFAAARARAAERPDGFHPLVAPLLAAWAAFGEGDLAAAEAALAMPEDRPVFRLFGRHHLGLMRLIRGDAAGALADFEAAIAGVGQAPTAMILARGAALESLGRGAEARALYAERAGGALPDPLAAQAVARLDSGAPAPLPVTDAASGGAEALQGLASVLGAEQGRRLALAYARLGDWLRPGGVDAPILIAELLEAEGQLEAAVRAYAATPPDSPLALRAEIGRANVLRRMERDDAAAEALRALALRAPDSVEVHLALGDTLRALKHWDDAAAAYDAAIALLEKSGNRSWAAYYQRGIAHERAGRWPLAEADFRKALDLEPDQPLVLNYLGYSWVDMGMNLPEAKAMIERAVELRPEDGYITDSLGWALFRMGDYPGAVEWLEKAVALAPDDPTINDHLGDAYWAVGRRLEAEFQWKRARSFDPEPKDLARIRRKLEIGLDAVRAEEEAAKPASDGN